MKQGGGGSAVLPHSLTAIPEQDTSLGVGATCTQISAQFESVIRQISDFEQCRREEKWYEHYGEAR